MGLGCTVILKILVMVAECKYSWINFQVTRAQFQVNRFKIFFVLKNVLRSEPLSNGHPGSRLSFPALYPLHTF